MAGQLDNKAVIDSLTEGIGSHFGWATRKSFAQQLERLQALPIFVESPLHEKQALVDLLALAAFYQTVVVTLRTSAEFISVVRKAGASHLRVAQDKLDQTQADRMKGIAQHFTALLTESGIPGQLLTYATLNGFVRAARKHFQGDGQ